MAASAAAAAAAAAAGLTFNLNDTSTYYGASSTATERASPPAPGRHLSPLGQALITCVYLIGILSNVCALTLLRHRKGPRNRSHGLMLRCLAWNDLLALLGSCAVMHLQLLLGTVAVGVGGDPGSSGSGHVRERSVFGEAPQQPRWLCALRVILRSFGLSSGCVAMVMAVERWLALTRPFVYQKHVTYTKIRNSILLLWLLVLVLVCLPFVGVGHYFEPGEPRGRGRDRCARYRSAVSGKNLAYAYVMLSVGLCLCLVIAACNLAVVRVLCQMGPARPARRTVVRKDSHELSFNDSTPEELSFAKLMVALCVFFIVCWLPQMMTIVVAQLNPGLKQHIFYRIADGCMALNFTLDPVFYVLSRKPHRRSLRKLFKPLCRCWSTRSRSSVRSSSQATSKESSRSLHRPSVQEPPLKVTQPVLRHYFVLRSSSRTNAVRSMKSSALCKSTSI